MSPVYHSIELPIGQGVASPLELLEVGLLSQINVLILRKVHPLTAGASNPGGDLGKNRDTLALVGLVQQLTAELTTAHGQRGEALGIGHMLADERDTLRARVEALESRLAQLLASPRSLLVRRQLLDILTR